MLEVPQSLQDVVDVHRCNGCHNKQALGTFGMALGIEFILSLLCAKYYGNMTHNLRKGGRFHADAEHFKYPKRATEASPRADEPAGETTEYLGTSRHSVSLYRVSFFLHFFREEDAVWQR